MAREEKTLTELNLQPTTGVDRSNDYLWTVDTSDTSMSAYGTSKKVKVEAFIGDTGATGDTGVGQKGDTGVDGDQGDTGIGEKGDTGSDGDQGDTGVGAKGDTGSKGDTGADSSVAGPKGDTGNAGDTGVGEKGDTGNSGAKGDTGVGEKGDTGNKGDTGADSTVAGPKGDTGVQGSTGVGEKGDTGNDGDTGVGEKGDTGSKGDTGADSTVAGPKGDTGTQGSTGVGEKGDTGEQGSVGSTGVQGDTGIGEKGDTGADSTVAGPKGDTGVKGDTGAGEKGDTGEEGDTGEQGNDGDTGVQGDTGIGEKGDTGSVGATGTAGNQGDTGVGQKGDTGVDGDTGVTYEWNGAWVTATVYALNDTVENDGSGYVCISAHTSGSATEPGVGASWTTNWDLFVEKGTTGDTGSSGSQGDTGVGTKGDTGEGGIQGDTGIGTKGDTGESGAVGATGTAGDQGDTGVGEKGDTGSQGLQGDTGQDGDTGVGVQGDTGPNSVTTSTTTDLTGYLYGDGSNVGTKGTEDGWIPSGETWTYASADDPTYTFTISGDLTGKYSAGMRIKLTQTTAKYFIITKVAYSSPNTTITVYGGTDYDLANATITSPYYSMVKAPQGFPLDPDKWSVVVTPGAFSQASATSDTWYNATSITIPIGVWDFSYRAYVQNNRTGGAGTTNTSVLLNISETSANGTPLQNMIHQMAERIPFPTNLEFYIFVGSFSGSDIIGVTAKDVLYMNIKGLHSSVNTLSCAEIKIRAICAYL